MVLKHESTEEVNQIAPGIAENCRVGIVYVNFNSSFILSALRSAVNQDYPVGNIRIWIVDNGSSDPNLHALRLFIADKISQGDRMIDLVSNRVNLGFSRGMNIGIRKALFDNCDLVICSTPDVIMDDSCVRLVAKAAYPDREPTLCFVLTRPHVHLQKTSTPILLRHRGNQWSRGHFFAVNRAFIREIGLFDEDFFIYGSDLDLFDRAYSSGAMIRYVTQQVIWHWEGTKEPGRAYADLNVVGLRRFQTVDFCRAGVVYLKKKRARGSLKAADASFITRLIIGHVLERLARCHFSAPVYALRGLASGLTHTSLDDRYGSQTSSLYRSEFPDRKIGPNGCRPFAYRFM